MVPAFQPAFTHLECFDCHATCDPSTPRAVCPTCGRPLVARYDLARIRDEVPRASLGRFGTDLWRYRFVLPFAPSFPAVRLGEGGTPLLPLPRTGDALGVGELWLKAEAGNPTQSFKARGLVMAINGALAFGQRGIALPSAGNAGSAAAAYAAAAGLPCRVAVPEDTPEAFVLEQRAFGAEVRLVKGTIADAGKVIAKVEQKNYSDGDNATNGPIDLSVPVTLGNTYYLYVQSDAAKSAPATDFYFAEHYAGTFYYGTAETLPDDNGEVAKAQALATPANATAGYFFVDNLQLGQMINRDTGTQGEARLVMERLAREIRGRR